MKSLYNLFIKELQNMYDSETQISESMPRFASGALSTRLKRVFLDRFKTTEKHLSRVENVCDENAVSAQGGDSNSMRTILSEGEVAFSKEFKNSITDAVLIATARKAGAYEIAGYNILVNWAKILGQEKAIKLFKKTLKEEKEADTKLAETVNTSKHKSKLEIAYQ